MISKWKWQLRHLKNCWKLRIHGAEALDRIVKDTETATETVHCE